MFWFYGSGGRMEGKFVSWGESIFQSRTGWKSNKSDLHLNDPCWIYFEAYVQNPKWVGIEYNLTFRLILPKQNQKHSIWDVSH